MVRSSDEVEAKLKAKYADLKSPLILHFGAAAQFPAAAPPADEKAPKK